MVMTEQEATDLFLALRPIILEMKESIGAIGIQSDGSVVVILLNDSSDIRRTIIERIHGVKVDLTIKFLAGGKIVPA